MKLEVAKFFLIAKINKPKVIKKLVPGNPTWNSTTELYLEILRVSPFCFDFRKKFETFLVLVDALHEILPSPMNHNAPGKPEIAEVNQIN